MPYMNIKAEFESDAHGNVPIKITVDDNVWGTPQTNTFIINASDFFVFLTQKNQSSHAKAIRKIIERGGNDADSNINRANIAPKDLAETANKPDSFFGQ